MSRTVRVVTNIDNLSSVLRSMEELSNKKLQIGILAGEESIIMKIAYVHEFGFQIGVTEKMRNYLHNINIHLKESTDYINIPERSFLRGGFDSNLKKIERIGANLLKKVIEGTLTVDAFYNAYGTIIVSYIQNYMTQLKEPANHPATIQNKGSSNPLIDTGELRSKITFEVI